VADARWFNRHALLCAGVSRAPLNTDDNKAIVCSFNSANHDVQTSSLNPLDVFSALLACLLDVCRRGAHPLENLVRRPRLRSPIPVWNRRGVAHDPSLSLHHVFSPDDVIAHEGEVVADEDARAERKPDRKTAIV